MSPSHPLPPSTAVSPLSLPPLPPRHRWRGKVVGLLGGSFNPPHAGHVHISRQALKYLPLDALWWLVSPQNPLKSHATPLPVRLRQCRRLTHHIPKLHLTAAEQHLHTRFTVDSLRALQRRYPQTRFVWIMGEDNIQQFHLWNDWQTIAATVPMVVLARGGYHARDSLSSPAARNLHAHRLPLPLFRQQLTLSSPLPLPLWCWLPIQRHGASSSALRLSSDPHTAKHTPPL